jgi:putative membrane protein
LAAMPFIIRTLVNAAALYVATRLVSGVTFTGEWLPFMGVAIVFGIVNAFIGPVAKILTFPLIIVTLGLFALVVNGLMLWLTSSISGTLGLGFHVTGFWAAFWGALVVSIVSTLLTIAVKDAQRR